MKYVLFVNATIGFAENLFLVAYRSIHFQYKHLVANK